jgi:alkyl hydroperoxide reductase subunit AhpC
MTIKISQARIRTEDDIANGDFPKAWEPDPEISSAWDITNEKNEIIGTFFIGHDGKIKETFIPFGAK